MKAVILFLALTASVGPTASPAPAAIPAPLTPPSSPIAAPAPPATATDPALPDAAFPASRYEALWTKSPFAVATSEEATETSPDYSLVGVANIGGISYASVVERQSQEHFLISSDMATRGLTLTSITRNHDGSETFAMVQKDGQSITLKLEQAQAGPPIPGIASAPPGQGPQIMTPQIPMPGAGGPLPNGAAARPFPARFHRPMIHLPPQPGQQQPVQVHPTPPPPQ